MTLHSQIKADPMAIARLLRDEHGNLPKGLPPVHQWHPACCGELPMHIKSNGEWWYQGTPILRPALVKLFSTILRHDDDGHFYLVTPVEKVKIVVDDAPFVAVVVDKFEENGVEYLCFKTQTDDLVVLDEAHSLWVNYDANGEPRPYIHVRDRLDALVSRTVFYQLVEWASIQHIDGRPCYAVQSAGQWFVIAPVDEG